MHTVKHLWNCVATDILGNNTGFQLVTNIPYYNMLTALSNFTTTIPFRCTVSHFLETTVPLILGNTQVLLYREYDYSIFHTKIDWKMPFLRGFPQTKQILPIELTYSYYMLTVQNFNYVPTILRLLRYVYLTRKKVQRHLSQGYGKKRDILFY